MVYVTGSMQLHINKYTPLGERITSTPPHEQPHAVFGGFISSSAGWMLSIVQELCESRGGRPGLSVLTSLMVSVDVKQY